MKINLRQSDIMRSFLLAGLCLLLGLPLQAQEDDEAVIRAIWTPDVFVLVNMSDDGVDLSELLLESAFGEIAPEDWVINRDESTNRLYSLADVRPGSCLVAAFGTAEPALPSGVTCTRVIAQIVISSRDNLIWSIDQGGFTPFVGDTQGEDCSIRTSSCTLIVPLAGDAGEADEGAAAEGESEVTAEVETVTIRAIWTRDIFVLINIAANGADLTNLTLESANGQITPDEWELVFSPQQNEAFTLDNVRPGSCLLAHVGDDRPELPPNVTCTRIIGSYIIEDLREVVWDVSQGGFTPFLNNVPGQSCSIQRTSCDVQAVNADAEPPAGGQVVAVWDETVLVIMNMSNISVDLSTFDLISGPGFILADDWELRGSRTLDAFAPGDCLVAFASGDDPENLPVPEEMTCNLIVGQYRVVDPVDAVWIQEFFTPEINGRPGEDCFGEDARCEINVPVAG